jgi:predicted GNAT family N-acyltransferase
MLNAQTHARGLYARFGFTQTGAEFMEAGIPHVAMERHLRERTLAGEPPSPDVKRR